MGVYVYKLFRVRVYELGPAAAAAGMADLAAASMQEATTTTLFQFQLLCEGKTNNQRAAPSTNRSDKQREW